MSYTNGEKAQHAMPPVKLYIEELMGRELTEEERMELLIVMSEGMGIVEQKIWEYEMLLK